MRVPSLRLTYLVAVIAAFLSRNDPAYGADSKSDAAAWFRDKGLSLIQGRCLACHGNDPKKLQADLDLRTRAGMLAGGKSGKPAIIAGDAERSLLFQAV